MPRAPQRIIVDGETFDIRERAERPGLYDLDWVSGPNPGYGFSSATSDGSSLSTAHLEKQVRDFLAVRLALHCHFPSRFPSPRAHRVPTTRIRGRSTGGSTATPHLLT